ILSVGHRGQAQTLEECTRIKLDAEGLRLPKDNEVKRNQQLMIDIMNLTEEIAGKGFEVPKSPFLPLPEFDDSRLEYHDDRNKSCPSWAGKDWGKIKDIREANLDKYRLYNNILANEVNWLQGIRDSVEKGITPTFTNPTALSEDIAPLGMIVDQATFHSKSYRYCIADPSQIQVKITPKVANFARLEKQVKAQGNQLLMAMNAGMFEPDRTPVGLLIMEGKEVAKLNVSRGKGNFYMPYNGVFGINTAGTPFIVSRKRYYEEKIDPSLILLATQSGPMLVLKNEINPNFTPNSSNKFFRNGVGITVDGKVIFAISNQRVNFHEFASFFQSLGCTTALYLDGTVSRMYAPMLSRYQDLKESDRLGPVLYIVNELN
ncbi:MAG: phosphodiester glycosidase family protein, partial [Bacteroidota bacterium]